ncbi:MAG: NAD-dependent epimerase/dehydratase family protein [Acidobacteriaceae bacterium]|nr:NAD-dependent epimerase/dehydratase family protein [Acidobacteriaceae bacterium]
MRCFVSGCAGFIGSHLVDRLLSLGHEVAGFDNLSTGRTQFMAEALRNPRFRFAEGDLLETDATARAMADCEFVFHLAANADVRFGTEHPTRDLQQNTIATVHVLEAMRETRAKRIAFASTGSIYGEAQVFPTPENHPLPRQTSLYGASKLGAEGFIEAYCEGFGMQGYIFRFVSILGERYTHGHVFDFVGQLQEHPEFLRVLGDGKQRKSYLYVQDCLDGILAAVENSRAKVTVLNLGTDQYCEVNQSIEWITEEMNVRPELIYAGGERGWIGDNPFIFLDCSAARALGWRPKASIKEGVARTVRYLREHPELFGAREGGFLRAGGSA